MRTPCCLLFVALLGCGVPGNERPGEPVEAPKPIPPRLWIQDEPRALAQLREAVGQSPPGGDVVDWLEAESRSVRLDCLLPDETFTALEDPAVARRIAIPHDWRERVPASLAAAFDRTCGRTSDQRARVIAYAAVMGHLLREDRASWEVERKDCLHGEGLEDAYHRVEATATTLAAVDLLYRLETRLEAVDGERRIAIGMPIHGCASAAGDRSIVTARRLVAPQEYEPELAAACAIHSALGRRIETVVTLAAVASHEGGVFRWPAPDDPHSPLRGLEQGPEHAGPWREPVTAEATVDGQRQSVQGGRPDWWPGAA